MAVFVLQRVADVNGLIGRDVDNLEILYVVSPLKATANAARKRVEVAVDPEAAMGVGSIEFAEPVAPKVLLKTTVGGDDVDLLTFDPSNNTIILGDEDNVGAVNLNVANVGSIAFSLESLSAALTMATNLIRLLAGAETKIEVTEKGVALFNDAEVGDPAHTFGGGDRVLFIANAATNPSSNPTGGSFLYVDQADGGKTKIRRADGTITTLDP
jgi:hypothetical protein